MNDIFLQPAVSLVMLYGGLLLGILYTGLRILRNAVRKRTCTAACDLLFIGCAACVTAYCVLRTTGGELRAFAGLILLAGFFISRSVFCGVAFSSFKKIHKY